MVKWVIKLSEFNISYRPRPSMKAQILADFIVMFTVLEDKVTANEPNEQALELVLVRTLTAPRTPKGADLDSS